MLTLVLSCNAVKAKVSLPNLRLVRSLTSLSLAIAVLAVCAYGGWIVNSLH